MISPSRSKTWQKLASHYLNLHHNGTTISKLCNKDAQRFNHYQVKIDGVLLDYSKNFVAPQTLSLLRDLANEAKLADAIKAMFRGDKLNATEERSVLHVALRTPLADADPRYNADVHACLEQMSDFVARVHEGHWSGYSGLPIKNIVNIGIGGSDLGPAMVYAALQRWKVPHIDTHFVSNLDPAHMHECIDDLDPATTLFIVTSKSFNTLETRQNAELARKWFLANGGSQKTLDQHFVAVTSNIQKACEFGIASKNIFPMWDWVGGRYSLWSAVGLSIALGIGMDAFKQLLFGARIVDEHFRDAPFEANIPVIMGLQAVWYSDFAGANSQAILPYSQELALFPAFLQQLEMESLGKSVERDGSRLLVPSGPIVWGSAGTNGQHSFHQFLHQGTHYIPADFIGVVAPPYPDDAEQHTLLLANCFSQSQALMDGKTQKEAFHELVAQGMDEAQAYKLAKHKMIAGNKPSNTLLLDSLCPQTLGSLVAIYEHKVFVESVIWNINAFDQWGVELGKQLSEKLATALNSTDTCVAFDPSTNGLINYCRNQND